MGTAAGTMLVPPLLLGSTNVIRCSALPYLPSRIFTTPSSPCSSPSPSLKHFSESRKFSLLQTRASSSEETSATVDASEVFTDWKQKARSLPIGWFREFSFILSFLLVNAGMLLKTKTTVLLYGGGAIVAVWLSSILVGAINSVPLLPKIMELVGVGYTGWFVYRYLLFKSSRKELATDIESLKKKIAGTE